MASPIPPSDTGGTPRILASASLPPVISFTSIEEPQLLITLTPIDFNSPITFALSHTRFDPLVNCLFFRNSTTSLPQYLPTMEINRGHASLKLCCEREADFVTIRPFEPYTFKVNFRPFGDTIFNKQLQTTLSIKEKYKYALTIGMHSLEIGETYEIGVQDGLRIPLWMAGDKEDLIPTNGREPALWKPTRGAEIEINAAPPTKFVVEA